MTTRAETIANHLRQIRGLSESDVRCLHLAFLETLGGAECASPAPASSDDAADLSATLRREECERKAARQAKPAGWVVRLSNGQLRWLWMRASGAEYEPYATREDAQRIADTTGGEAVPVDGDGNVIEAEGSRADDASFEAEAHRLRIVADGANARCSAAEKERDEARSELAAVKAERDRLATELDRIRTDRDGLVTEMIAEGQSAIWMRQRLGVKDSETLREVVDRLAAEVQAAREQKPVRWALQGADGRVVGTFSDEVAARGAADRPGDVVAPLYLAPVVRDHSEVIAQCEEALKEWDRNGAFCSATSSLVAVTLTKARNALRGAP